MGDFALNHHVTLHGFFNTAFNEGHWNETGHEVAGSITTQDLLTSSALLPNSQLGTGQRENPGQWLWRKGQWPVPTRVTS
jgi:hypothetical protein